MCGAVCARTGGSGVAVVALTEAALVVALAAAVVAPVGILVDVVALEAVILAVACITLAFGINKTFKDLLKDNKADGHIGFFLLEKEDKPNPRAKDPFVRLNAKNNIYAAFGTDELNGIAGKETKITGCVQAGTSASSFELTNVKKGDSPSAAGNVGEQLCLDSLVGGWIGIGHALLSKSGL